VNIEARLAEIVTALEAAGLRCLVMGGHAVRYYGFVRNTNDFDLHLAPDRWDELPELLRRSVLFAGRPVIEGPSWRAGDFRRFQMGTAESGREEWLEFWRHNHLLAPFEELFARREVGSYGGREIAFLSLRDLIRSKETERETDWQDIAVLEEILDTRCAAKAEAGTLPLSSALAQLRSRRGFESHLQRKHFDDSATVLDAARRAATPMSFAFLAPFMGDAVQSLPAKTVEPLLLRRLRAAEPASRLHLALVEVVRRAYKRRAQAVDKADKARVAKK
jgi:hypothetical protein